MPNINKNTFKPSWLPERPNTRATGDQRFYNSWSWRKCSTLYRKAHPLCENCFEKGRLADVDVVDHIIPMPEGEALDVDNFMSLCHVCHNSKSGLEGKKGGPLIDYAYGLPVRREDIFLLLK